ncbi:MAG: zeta toxin family protein [Methylotenera sp.]|nr:zeta toxin family protein [Methylotenera sp.]MDP1754635.1 zeta toxin family protein [Methylotenera sp.]MDP1959891.1 zeta toxin family protein [Methylotenera sp.]MDP3942036.1 zeta toxin family protein [Methylotenera sp.]
MQTGKKIIIIAGPNGAGKTTFAREFLPNEANCPIFINADLIAAGLAPFAPETAAIKAARLMLHEIADNVKAGNSFAFETTLSGKAYAKHIMDWKKSGYHITLFFLSLPSAEFAMARVSARVAAGGHDIPELTIRRRFKSGINNFHSIYKPLADAWSLYDNSSEQPILLETGEK